MRAGLSLSLLEPQGLEQIVRGTRGRSIIICWVDGCRWMSLLPAYCVPGFVLVTQR